LPANGMGCCRSFSARCGRREPRPATFRSGWPCRAGLPP
jgi:hypothetical protein